MIRNQLITTLRRQDMRSDHNRTSADETNTPADGTKDPTLVKSPTNKEAVIVIEQICLPSLINQCQFVATPTENQREPTTIAILAACTTAERIISRLRILHPFSRIGLPPVKMTRYVTRLIPCRTTAKDIRNPTERHIEQKYRSSPRQSSCWGKCSQVSVREEQRRWRPYE